MKLLDSITVYHGEEEKHIEICQGDLSYLTPAEAVDVLVVSAFPDDYVPTSTSLIGALYRRGVSVAALAENKAEDWRETLSCWLSQRIDPKPPGIEFDRILCFEPLTRGMPPEVVGDIFRCLTSVCNCAGPVKVIAMPLVATGDQQTPVAEMIEPLLDAAVHWMALGLQVERLKIVAYSEEKADELAHHFALLKEDYKDFTLPHADRCTYDVFLSYAHLDAGEKQLVVEELRRLRPELKIFLDEQAIDVGAAWQQKVYEAIDDCRMFFAMLSPSYVHSKVCIEEFNIALYRRRETGEEIIFPIYLDSEAPRFRLPSYMGALVNFIDCRTRDVSKIRGACARLLENIGT